MSSLIAIDARHVPQQPAGSGRYALSLVRALANVDSEYRFVVYAAHHSLPELQGLGPRVRVIRPDAGPLRRLFTPTMLALDLARRGADLLHTPTGPSLLRSPCPRVVTVHDLAPFLMPGGYQEADRLKHQAETLANVSRARAVIVPSESAARDFEAVFDLPSEHVSVTPEGVGTGFRPLDPEVSGYLAQQRYGLPPGYLLTVGARGPAKNREPLFRALRLLCDAGSDLHLAVAGEPTWLTPADEELVRELGLERNVHFTGYVREEDLPSLYSAASVFVLPSLMEGFGLPVLEAMACGTPVVTSDQSSLPEAAGEAALLVDPTDPDAIATAIANVLDNEREAAELRLNGLKRASDFSWEACAEKTLAVYRQVLGE